jgi:glycosyltransferase involved in cell wall biosynthesis
MRVLIVTDAWRPQVNGVVRTLERLKVDAEAQGVDIQFITPSDYPSTPLPGYPEIRLALTSPQAVSDAIEAHSPDALHIATEGPLGWMARHAALRMERPFTTCYHTRYPQYVAARYPVPPAFTYGVLRYFHNAGVTTMVATEALQKELLSQGFRSCSLWSRGVDSELFRPLPDASDNHPRPIFLCVSRLAIEKNLDGFLSLKLPGTKVIVGDGPDRARLESTYPDVIFTGALYGEALAAAYASADVFVFPSLTETFGNVLLESLACGTPVATFPTEGLVPSIIEAKVGIANHDLRKAAIAALSINRDSCRNFALLYSHEQATRQFIENVSRACRPHLARAA